MATFYLLPPRPAFEAAVARFIEAWAPGLPRPTALVSEIAEALQTRLGQEDTFLVFREELPDGAEPVEGLRDGFGATAGDQVIELRSGPHSGEVVPRSWRVEELSAIRPG
jgi:hypothetical protein